MSFPGSTGARLAGVLHLPEGQPVGSVLLVHCFTCSKDLHTLTRLARGLSAAGYAVLRFDFTGIGDSGGSFVDKQLHMVRSLVVVGAPSSPAHVRGLIAGSEEQIRTTGAAEVDIGARPFPISAAFLADLERHDQKTHVAQLGCPLLVLHAPDDEVVPISEGEANSAAAAHPKAFWPLLDTDHLVSSRTAAERLLATVTLWLSAPVLDTAPAAQGATAE